MSQEPAMFEQPSADALDALISARLRGLPAPDGAERFPDGAFALALLDAAGQTRLDVDFSADLEARLRAAWRPQGNMRRISSLAPWLRGPRAVAAAILLVIALLGALLAVPQVRAAVGAILHIGSVSILPVAPTPGPHDATPLTSPLDLAGQTTLADARQRMPFTIRLPAYPADLGSPQYVFAQDLGGSAVMLVWLEPGSSDRVRMSLSELSSDVYFQKFAPPVLQETTVHGQRAIWTDGPYIVETKNGQYVQRRLITGHVLIWTEGGVTYRLETSLSLPEAVRVAESLR
jgi:hypothetical protein